MPLRNDQKNIWFKLANQNLTIFMRDAGFDLSVYSKYPEDVQKEVKRLTILEAIRSLRSEYLDMTGCPFQNLKKGAYVIRLSDNMSMFYVNRHHSPVIYIGHGSIETRLKKHYEDKLFDFMLSLNGMNFDFYV